MGVRGLESFLKKQVVNGVFSVNILDEIDRKKRLTDIKILHVHVNH